MLLQGKKINPNQPQLSNNNKQKKNSLKISVLRNKSFHILDKIFLSNHKIAAFTRCLQCKRDVCKRVSTTFRNPCLDTAAPVKRGEKTGKCFKTMLTV